MRWILLPVVFLIGTSINRAQNELSDNLDSLKDKVPGLEGIDTSKVPAAETIEKGFKEKCIKLAGEDAFDKANVAKNKFIECIKAQVNITTLQEEMEDAKPTGDLDTVFGKYCKKTPIVMACMKEFTTALDPCLEEKEKESKTMILNITESLADFLCHKDGDRIAMFIAEGGWECMTEKQEALQDCVNATLGEKIPTDMPDVDNIPLLVIKEEQCNDLTKIQECVVNELEKCSEPTPANIMESLFKFIRRVTPCETLGKKTNVRTSSQTASTSSAASILSSIVLVTGAILLKVA